MGYHQNYLRKLYSKLVQLLQVFNLSLEEGIVPSEWKDANNTRLFKGGGTSQTIIDQ